MDSVLRPRDIQARIRSGESPETVAAAAQTSVDKIMGFATPVLAERAYVAQQAQRASVRRRAGDGPIGHLGDAVATRLTADQVDPDTVEWDAWRREDGRWALVADYPAVDGRRQARFVFDLAGRYVIADDDEARRLVGELAQGVGAGSPPAEDQISLGDDAIEVVTGRRPQQLAEVPRPTSTPDDESEPTVDLSETTRALRSAPAPSQSAPSQSDWIRTQASERPASAPVPDETLFDAADVAGYQPQERTPGESDPSPEDSSAAASSSEPAAEDPAEPQEPPKPKKSTRGKGRASVPSWDEIMFGSGRGD